MSRLWCTSIVILSVSSWALRIFATAGMITLLQWRASTAMRSCFFIEALCFGKSSSMCQARIDSFATR